MTLRFDRGLPPAVALALLGGVLALLALLLPWYSLNEETLRSFMREIMGAVAQMSPEPVSTTDIDAMVQLGMPTLMEKASAELVGYKAFRPLSVGLHALAAAGGIVAALKVWSGESTLQQQRTELLLAAAIVAVRPILAIVRTPGMDGAPEGFSSVNVPDGLFAPSTGVYVALLGAALFLVAAFLTSQPAAEPEWAPVADAAPVPTAYMPGGAAPAASATYAQTPAPGGASYAQPASPYAQPASPYAQPASPYAQPVPTPYMPGDAYGAEGPGTLDRDSRILRPNDPLAPAPLAVPAVPIMPVPAAVTPLRDPAPVAEAPGSTYGVPRPQAPAPTPPTRSGSTAPPGFG